MDAQASRFRRNENVAPTLHSRHKSTGNLNLKASAANAGFRGPAKRAAFGDVTNTTKNTLGRDTSKSTKLGAPKTATRARAASSLGKENTGFVRKDVLNQSSQQNQQNALRSTAVIDKKVELNERPATAGTRDLTSLSFSMIEEEPTHNVTSQKPVSQRLRGPGPRHHKSQPDLKVRHQTLRRTQSRISDRPQVIEEDAVEDEIIEELAVSPVEAEAEGEAVEDLSMNGLDVPYKEHLNEADVTIEDPVSATTEDFPIPNLGGKPAVASALSEPEECWEEDEEEYDDQDQAFTTAHSFPSRDQTTGVVTAVVQPKVTSRVQRELEDAKIEVQATRSFEDIEEEMWDVSMVAEYGDDIFEYMRELEGSMLPNAHYMDVQTEIQWSMRSVLMDWLVQVHNRFCLLPETLFLTVNYIDRFLSNKVVSIGKLQLVGATAILLASKYEEINCPSLQEIIYMVDGGYTMDEILKAERFMLSMLNYELGWPGPMSFLRRVSKADDYDLDTRTLAKYFLELTIMDERFVASPPSFLAAGAHCLSRFILRKGEWTKAHVHYSGYTLGQLWSLVNMMIDCCASPRSHHGAIFEKYSDKRFKEAATVVQQELDQGFDLSQYAPTRRSTRFNGFPMDQYTGSLHQGSQFLAPIEG